MEYTDINSLIETNPEHSRIDFGSEKTAPSEDRIKKIEASLGLSLPESYKWFLRTYTGGEVNGDEIYSIYQTDDEETPSGNLIYQHRLNKRLGYIESHEIPLMQTDSGELFLLDASVMRENNEYSVYVKRGEIKQLFADNFMGFLTKVISQHFD